MSLGRQAALDLVAFILRNDDTAGTFWDELGSGILPSAIAGDGYISLHNGDPKAGDQDTNEITWSGYARVPVTREQASWSIQNQRLVLNVDVDFGVKLDAGIVEATHWAWGTRETGPGFIVFSGPMSLEISRPFTIDNTVSGNKLIVPGHFFTVDSQVQFRNDIGGTALPSGLSEDGYWYVVEADQDGIKISSTQGGGALPLGDGSGRCAVSSIFRIDTGNSILFPAQSLTALIG